MKRPPPRSLCRALAVAFVLTTAGLVAAGCGGASMSGGAQEPSSAKAGGDMAAEPLPPPPTTVDEALAQLQTAELDINASLPGSPRQYAQPPAQDPAHPDGVQPAAPTVQQSPPPPPGRAEAKKAESAGAADAESLSTPPPDPCTTACRALASMDRAAAHLCGLAGAEDPRCGNARERLQVAEVRVRQSCPHCAAH